MSNWEVERENSEVADEKYEPYRQKQTNKQANNPAFQKVWKWKAKLLYPFLKNELIFQW